MADPLLTDEELADAEEALPGWSVDRASLRCTFEFADFVEAFAFMVGVALVAERMNHHPDWSNSWNRVEVSITNHDAGGVSRRCVELATAAQRLAT